MPVKHEDGFKPISTTYFVERESYDHRNNRVNTSYTEVDGAMTIQDALTKSGALTSAFNGSVKVVFIHKFDFR